MGIYLDHNASTPVDERVAEAMLAVLRAGQGNPSSVHGPGRAARAAIEQAREQVAALVGAAPGQVVFTSGGTEANNLALHAVLADAPPGRLVVSAIEHASLLEAAEGWSRRGWSLERAGVDGSGRVTPEHLAAVLTPDTRLVSVMMANNETGAVQDIAPLASRARDAGAVFHTDAIQAAGKLPVDFGASGAQLMSLSAHKLYGPKGVGAL
ncbi:MAG TPA: aminotransferase class V-fold PLP-dependent enzyme, partial [Gammaproteobacteria bacterium]|nr:aminotransferase class V-fold PLP-dependent enzyme [Gammaproteobacteria bacterium]